MCRRIKSQEDLCKRWNMLANFCTDTYLVPLILRYLPSTVNTSSVFEMMLYKVVFFVYLLSHLKPL